VRILNRLKSNYVSKESLSGIAKQLGFLPVIIAPDAELIENTQSLLEDVFEAFIGVTVKILDDTYMEGVGYGVAYKILSAIFDAKDISIDYKKLFDAKTRLKERADTQKMEVVYNIQRGNTTTCNVYLVSKINQPRQFICSYEQTEKVGKKEMEQLAAAKAIDVMDQRGMLTVKPPDQLACENFVFKRMGV
jgi:dsRNA-specific ribonuclease